MNRLPDDPRRLVSDRASSLQKYRRLTCTNPALPPNAGRGTPDSPSPRFIASGRHESSCCREDDLPFFPPPCCREPRNLPPASFALRPVVTQKTPALDGHGAQTPWRIQSAASCRNRIPHMPQPHAPASGVAEIRSGDGMTQDAPANNPANRARSSLPMIQDATPAPHHDNRQPRVIADQVLLPVLQDNPTGWDRRYRPLLRRSTDKQTNPRNCAPLPFPRSLRFNRITEKTHMNDSLAMGNIGPGKHCRQFAHRRQTHRARGRLPPSLAAGTTTARRFGQKYTIPTIPDPTGTHRRPRPSKRLQLPPQQPALRMDHQRLDAGKHVPLRKALRLETSPKPRKCRNISPPNGQSPREASLYRNHPVAPPTRPVRRSTRRDGQVRLISTSFASKSASGQGNIAQPA